MNQLDRLDRDLTTWFAATAAPRIPDDVDTIVALATVRSQRPTWSFPERWLPDGTLARGRQVLRPVPWRTVVVLAILVVLATAAVVYVGSQPRPLPAPFGPAANGLVAYGDGGYIFTVDPINGARTEIAPGPGVKSDPRFSLDGSRLAFVETTTDGTRLAIADPAGRVVARSEPLNFPVDSENLLWSPDGGSILFASAGDGSVWIADTITGRVRGLPIRGVDGDMSWRPPDGRQILFLDGTDANRWLSVVWVATGIVEPIRLDGGDNDELRPAGWSWDGRRVIFHRRDADSGRLTTIIRDLESGEQVSVRAAYPRLSNDGTRLVSLAGDEMRTWLCVASIDGGPCERISEIYDDPMWGTDYHWSPDDQWIITTRRDGDGKTFVLDPDRLIDEQPAWSAKGAESWQRVAPP
jgi:Tol biopolymer transport system component